MRDEFLEAGMTPLEIPSPQTFCHVWRTDFPQLKIPRHNPLGVHNICSLLNKTHSESSCTIARKAEFTRLISV
jgi:hypothetical protein